jgi:hypothetical protein
MKHCPGLRDTYRDEGYSQAIQFAFAAKTGGLLPKCPEEYDRFVRDVEFRLSTLVRRPRVFLQLVALKLRIAALWPHLRPIARFLRARS